MQEMYVVDPENYAEITALSAEGDRLAAEGFTQEAIERYSRALERVPPPKEQWETSTWLYTAIGDVAFQAGDYQTASEALEQAIRCPGALTNPFIRLRRGQTFYERGDFRRADEDLSAAHSLEGDRIFADEDGKYLLRITNARKPPISG